MSTITIVDYGVGNLHSVAKGLRHAGANVELSSDPVAIANAKKLVLPGVGAFGDGMAGLRSRGLVGPLLAYVQTGRPFLGICLGMQLLLSESEEFGHHEGLGIIPGRVTRIEAQPGDKVPHVGWNALSPPREGAWKGTVLDGLTPGVQMYFVHSYVPVPTDPAHVLALTGYSGHAFASVIRRDHVVGCQFHPEKSGEDGLVILRNFVRS